MNNKVADVFREKFRKSEVRNWSQKGCKKGAKFIERKNIYFD